jgi:hypothetical protein
MLHRDLDALRARQEEHFSWEAVGEIEALERELELANRVIFALSEKVRQSWA